MRHPTIRRNRPHGLSVGQLWPAAETETQARIQELESATPPRRKAPGNP
jgi:hypothetical protein